MPESVPAARDAKDDESTLDDLRARVYGPDATEEDRRRYADRLTAMVAEPEAPPEADGIADPPQAGPISRRRRRFRIAAAAVVVAALAAVGAGVVLLRPSTSPPGPAPEVLPLSAEERSTMANALVIGTDAGIAAYLVTNRAPHGLLHATSAYTVEQRGVGPANLNVLTLPRTDHGVLVDGRTGETLVADRGRVTVLLVVAQAGEVGWQAEVGTTTVAERGGFQGAGSLTSATVDYGPGRRPDRLRVEVPAGVPWGVAVVYSD